MSMGEVRCRIEYDTCRCKECLNVCALRVFDNPRDVGVRALLLTRPISHVGFICHIRSFRPFASVRIYGAICSSVRYPPGGDDLRGASNCWDCATPVNDGITPPCVISDQNPFRINLRTLSVEMACKSVDCVTPRCFLLPARVTTRLDFLWNALKESHLPEFSIMNLISVHPRPCSPPTGADGQSHPSRVRTSSHCSHFPRRRIYWCRPR